MKNVKMTAKAIMGAVIWSWMSSLALGTTILATSQLLQCVQNGSSSLRSCQKRLVVTLTVPTGSNLATELIEVDPIRCVNTEDSSCPNGCPPNDEDCRELVDPIQLSLTKSQVLANYELSYTQSFNHKPMEVVMYTGTGGGSPICRDGANEQHPTCGWYTDVLTGVQVPDSQGFCCPCTFESTWGDTLGGGSPQLARGNVDCSLLSNPLFIGGVPASAHCMNLNTLWHAGYNVGRAEIDYTIDLLLQNKSSNQLNLTEENQAETISVTPQTPIQLSSDAFLSLQLLGDLASFVSPPVLSEKILLIPTPQGASPQEVFNGDKSRWMLVDKGRFSFTGTECDKIGTGFTAFRTHPDKCQRPMGTCLANQISDLYDDDQQRVNAGQTPLYFLSQWGTVNLKPPSAGAQAALSVPLTELRHSIVVLNMVADNLKFVINQSPGKIVETKVCTFNLHSCGSFEASTLDGYIIITLQNTGPLDAAYTVTVTNCTERVLPPPTAQHVNIPSQSTFQVGPSSTFRVRAEDNEASQRKCMITMYDSTGVIIDTKDLSFNTTETNMTEIPQSPGERDGDLLRDPRSSLTCAQRCKLYNIICNIMRGCWQRLLLFVLIVLGSFIGACAATYLLLKLATRTLTGSIASGLTPAERKPAVDKPVCSNTCHAQGKHVHQLPFAPQKPLPPTNSFWNKHFRSTSTRPSAPTHGIHNGWGDLT